MPRIHRLLLVLLACGTASAQSEQPAPTFPVGSAENDALALAAPFSEANPDFTLRQDYWEGQLTPDKGTAFRLQFFKGNTYHMFLAVEKDKLPTGATLALYVIDPKNKPIEASAPGLENTAQLSHKAKKTGLYLVLMRLILEDGATIEAPLDAVMIYGWE